MEYRHLATVNNRGSVRVRLVPKARLLAALVWMRNRGKAAKEEPYVAARIIGRGAAGNVNIVSEGDALSMSKQISGLLQTPNSVKKTFA